jgi:hypothetical protein
VPIKTVSVDVIKTYHVTVESNTDDEAELRVRAMPIAQIEKEGSLEEWTCEYIEVVDAYRAD